MFRLRSGLTQEALAARAQVSRQTIISLESGRFDPSLRVAFILAAVFDATVDDLFSQIERTSE